MNYDYCTLALFVVFNFVLKHCYMYSTVLSLISVFIFGCKMILEACMLSHASTCRLLLNLTPGSFRPH